METTHTKPERQLSREERRFIERTENEARIIHDRLCDKFLTFLVHPDADPESEEAKDLISDLSAKWKMYCSKKGIKSTATHLLVRNNCENLIKVYKKSKDETAPELDLRTKEDSAL